MNISKSKLFLNSALWIVILAASIVGRLIDSSSSSSSENIVVEQNRNINLEQAKEWKQEFYKSAKEMPRTSRIDYFPSTSTATIASNTYRNTFIGGDNSNNARFQRGFEERLDSYYSRLNPRQFSLQEMKPEAPRIKIENLEWMLKNIFTYPRNHGTNETAKEIVQKYIRDSFHITSGLPTTTQQFEPIQFLSMYDGSTVPTGTNIIAILKGAEWGTGKDKPVVIGAHWDTVNFTPGTDDNGSGVAAMLEVARVVSHAECKPKYSIIFVAFDLEEVGSQGSLVFIKDYLAQILNSNFPNDLGYSTKFQGAFIMDTIMDFNATEESQTFPTDWSLVVPDVYDEVANENYKGDFLSMIFRRGIDNRMAEKFNYHWLNSKHDSKFRLKPFPLYLSEELPDLQILSDHLNFLRSDHARFWYMNDTDVPHTLNAVLMTDTGPYRGNMRHCYHSICDGPEVSIYENPENLKFLEKITQVLAETILDMSECGNFNVPQSQQSSFNNNFLAKRSFGSNSRSSSTRNISPLTKDLSKLMKYVQKISS